MSLNKSSEDTFLDISKDSPKDISKDISKNIFQDIEKTILKKELDIVKKLATLNKNGTNYLAIFSTNAEFKGEIKFSSEDISKNIFEDISKNISEDISKDISKNISKNISEDISKNASKGAPEHTIEDISKQFLNISLNVKSKKINKNPIFIGVSIDNKIIESVLKNLYNFLHNFLHNKKIKGEFHLTLVFKPNEIQINEIPEEGTFCIVYLEAIGCSNDAIAIKVQKISTESGEEVKYFLKDDGILHITVALADGIKPVNSYLAIKNGNYTEFESVITVKGIIKYYY